MGEALTRKRAFKLSFIVSTCLLLTGKLFHTKFDVKLRPTSGTLNVARNVYTCGHDLSIFVKVLLPEYTALTLHSGSEAKSSDLLAIGMHGECLEAKTFPGRVFYVNGESEVGQMVQRALYLGPVQRENHTHKQFYYASYAALVLDVLHVLKRRPQPRKDRFLLYVQSNCVSEREAAFAMFAALGKVSAAGKCHGGLSQYERVSRAGDWTNDVDVYSRYMFGLVMENTYVEGYVTEKIVAAFAGGTIPIYHGTEEVFKLFNRKAFIFFNKSNAEQTMLAVRHLMENSSAYEDMLTQPILSEQQYNRYFSLHRNGILYQEIREFLRVAPERKHYLQYVH